MTVITSQCPGCGVDKMPLNVRAYSKREQYMVYAFVTCPTCHLPAALLLTPGSNAKATTEWFFTSAAKGEHDACEASGWGVRTSWPQYLEKSAPEHTPPDIARLYRQAASASSRQEFEAAGFLYGKVLEASIKQLDPEITGSLARRIEALAEKKILSPEVAAWAHEIRIIRNDAVHELEQPSPNDVSAISEFAEAFLLVVYTMREKYKARQSKKSG